MTTATLEMVGVSFLQEGASGYYYDRTICLCSCGRRFYSTRDKSNTCECGNQYFKMISRPSKDIKTNIGGIFTCLESNYNSFKVKKKELIANILVGEGGTTWRRVPEDFSVTFSTAKEYTLDYSLRDKRYDVYCEDKKLEMEDGKDRELFFRGNISKDEFVDGINDEKLKYILCFAFEKLGKVQNTNKRKWSLALSKLFNHSYIELLNNCGLGKHLSYIYSKFNYGNRVNHKDFTKPHEFFEVPKYMMKYIKEMDNVGDTTLNAFRRFGKAFDSNKFQTIMQIFKEESHLDTLFYNDSLITDLHTKYGYKDIKKLALYVTRDVKLSQGIMSVNTALTLLRDYAKMATLMEISYEKFPKSLKKEHDVTMMNYKVVESELKNKEFQLAVKNYEDLAYTTKKSLFEIVLPSSSSELVKEGSALNHCIASYVDNVISGSCIILFLRVKENINKPHISIEIRDGNIRQARGQSNRSINKEGYEEEYKFLTKWAEKNELKVSFH